MPKISRWILEPKTEKELLDQLWTSIGLLKNKGEIVDFLKGLLMPSESLMLAKRIAMVKLQDANPKLSFTEIRKLLHITRVTAYRWKERYGLYRKEFKIIIDRLMDLEKKLSK